MKRSNFSTNKFEKLSEMWDHYHNEKMVLLKTINEKENELNDLKNKLEDTKKQLYTIDKAIATKKLAGDLR